MVHNFRLSDENLLSCKIARNVEEGVQTINLRLVDVGIQTHLCPVIYQPIPTSTNCASEFHSIQNNYNLCKLEQCHSNTIILSPCDNCNDCNNCISPRDSDKISISPCQLNHSKICFCVSPSDNCACSGESKNIFDVLFDKENLQCKLNEMKLLKKEEICDTEHETKEQYQKKLDEANAQMEAYETAILYKEYELKNSQIRGKIFINIWFLIYFSSLAFFNNYMGFTTIVIHLHKTHIFSLVILHIFVVLYSVIFLSFFLNSIIQTRPLSPSQSHNKT